ncbi:MAG: hypothetical protein NTZ05_10500 [Chloroflexi bacterium]|nr:hypothetical protein [Chloroflexota bacterium]
MEHINETQQGKAGCGKQSGNLGARYDSICRERNGGAHGVLLSAGRVPADQVGKGRREPEQKTALRALLNRVLRRSQ